MYEMICQLPGELTPIATDPYIETVMRTKKRSLTGLGNSLPFSSSSSSSFV